MRFSQLDRKISLRRITSTTQDDYGQPNNTTADTDVWAQVIYAGSPSESKKAYQIFPQRDVAFIIRHPDPTDAGTAAIGQDDTIIFESRDQDDTIIFESREYDILGFEEIGRRDGLRIFCKEKGSDGR
jgi:hypothetical protein